MGVKPIGANVLGGKCVHKPLSGLHKWLGNAGNAIHSVGYPYTVKVYRGGFGEIINEIDFQRIVLLYPYFRAGHCAVVVPDIGGGSGKEFVCSFGCYQL